MRCSFHRKKNPEGKYYNCKAFIYGLKSEEKITIKKIQSNHSHFLMTTEAIKIKLNQMQISIPEKVREDAYRLFINGESITDIYNLIKKSFFAEQKCPFDITPLRNYLYNRNKQEYVNYNNVFEMYEKLKLDQGITKVLVVKTLGDGPKLKGLSFTFREQQIGINFTDVIGIDATYNICKEKVAFVIFTAINKFGQTIILMGSLISREDFQSYKFALESFEEFFCIPATVITDQDPALKSAIDCQWKGTKHIFCLFHIYRNIQKKVAKLLGKNNEKFLKEFSRIQKIEKIEFFEEEWNSFIEQYAAIKSQEQSFEQDFEEESLNEILECKGEINESDEEYNQEESRESRDINKNILNYLLHLSKSRKSWAKCYTYRHFGAGFFFPNNL